jgi:hypothetical protein
VREALQDYELDARAIELLRYFPIGGLDALPALGVVGEVAIGTGADAFGQVIPATERQRKGELGAVAESQGALPLFFRKPGERLAVGRREVERR